MKVYETEMDRPVDLNELISDGGVAPENAAEVETEWELLEGGVASIAGGELKNANSDSVVRRYEFFKYTGPYKAEDHSPDYHYGGEIPPNFLGDFIAANMVAAILIPEPSTIVLAIAGFGALTWVALGWRRT
jgi:hypothetical protein